MKSILRYVGGKSRAVKHILPYLEGADTLYSPFFGEAQLSLPSLRRARSSVVTCTNQSQCFGNRYSKTLTL